MSKFEYDVGLTVKEAALRKGDQKVMCRIADVNLFACEANYHKSCHRNCLRNQDVGRSKNEETRKEQKELEEARAGIQQSKRNNRSRGNTGKKCFKIT